MKTSKDVLFIMSVIFAGILIIILWALAKSFGWIHSPAWVSMIPLFGGAVTLGGIGVGVGKLLQKVDRVTDDVDKVDDKTDDLNNKIISLETNVGKIDDKTDDLNNRVIAIETGITGFKLRKISGLEPEIKKEER